MPVTAGRVRNRIEKVLRHAIDGPNPVAWEILQFRLPPMRRVKKTKHFAAMRGAACAAGTVAGIIAAQDEAKAGIALNCRG